MHGVRKGRALDPQPQRDMPGREERQEPLVSKADAIRLMGAASAPPGGGGGALDKAWCLVPHHLTLRYEGSEPHIT